MANNRIYLTCLECGEQICIGKSFCEGAYYKNYSDIPLEDRLNDFYEKHVHLESAESCNLLGTNFYIEHEYFDEADNKRIRDLYLKVVDE